ncbi:MAG: hypothetical protein KKG33_12955 [candidate division Zixibacteria bacterium]|nr:hypothetical protein [candidate division Zixibacteria bacterium]MBU1470710.1 hypothetical protein [candidate division Zixibacteria bacterium]MBU2626462.1 hypothetical protein [candidate division Zixibacteria bacterium]
MNSTLAYLRGRRLWVVENLVVWGSLSAYSGHFLVTDELGGDKRLLFWQVSLGGDLQQTSFADLTDINGNVLPAIISRPKIVVLSKNGVNVAVVGRESNTTFTIAKTVETSTSGLVDLLIFEVGS